MYVKQAWVEVMKEKIAGTRLLGTWELKSVRLMDGDGSRFVFLSPRKTTATLETITQKGAALATSHTYTHMYPNMGTCLIACADSEAQ